jgi:hypothetical protein
LTDAIDTRIAAFLLWGGGTVAIYTIVLVLRIRHWRRTRKDRRHQERIEAARDVIAAFALWLVAFASGASVALVLFGTPGSGIRGLAVAIALGAFTGAGLVMASEDREAHSGDNVP